MTDVSMTDAFWRGFQVPTLTLTNYHPENCGFCAKYTIQTMELPQSQLKKYSDITNQLAKDLPSPNTRYIDKAYQYFSNLIITAAKRAIPRGRRNKYRTCWDAE